MIHMSYRGTTSVTQLKLASRFVILVGLQSQQHQRSPALCTCQGDTPQVCGCVRDSGDSLQAWQRAWDLSALWGTPGNRWVGDQH